MRKCLTVAVCWVVLTQCAHEHSTIENANGATHTHCRPRNPTSDLRCSNYGIRVLSSDGCPREYLEAELDLWAGPLSVWTKGSIKDHEVDAKSMSRTIRLLAHFDAQGHVLYVRSISNPPVPAPIEKWLPILTDFSVPHPCGVASEAVIEWDATCPFPWG